MHTISVFYLSAVADYLCYLLVFVCNVLFISIHGDHHHQYHYHHQCEDIMAVMT